MNRKVTSLFFHMAGGVQLGCPSLGSLGSMVIGSMVIGSPTYKWDMLNSCTTDPNLLQPTSTSWPGHPRRSETWNSTKKYREPKWLKKNWPTVAFWKGAFQKTHRVWGKCIAEKKILGAIFWAALIGLVVSCLFSIFDTNASRRKGEVYQFGHA